MFLFVILYIVIIIHTSYPLLCYNGTFTNRRYGEDPIQYRGLFTPSLRTMARIRCSLTIPCTESGGTVAVLLLFVSPSGGLLCYNCSSNQRDWNPCAGDFVASVFPFNNTKNHLVNCTGDNAMCFVRSWTARARHAWIVQRGCYQSAGDDTLPTSMSIPTRAMTCRRERHADAEYKVCLCQADWCNSACSIIPHGSIIYYLNKYCRNINEYFAALYICILRVIT